MRIRTALAVGGMAFFFSAAATAEIRIETARYAGGVLLVRGQTAAPFQIVSLDGRYERRSDKDGYFVFRIAYRPLFCAVDLTSGSEFKSVEVENCKTHIPRLPSKKANRASNAKCA